MKIAITLSSLFLFSFAASKSLSLFGGDQKVLDGKLDVPGDNPLEFCQAENTYTLTINKVDLTPNPPLP